MSASTSSCCLCCYLLSISRRCHPEFRQSLILCASCQKMQMARSESPAATLTTSSNWCINKSNWPQVSHWACPKSRSNLSMSSSLTPRTSQTHNGGQTPPSLQSLLRKIPKSRTSSSSSLRRRCLMTIQATEPLWSPPSLKSPEAPSGSILSFRDRLMPTMPPQRRRSQIKGSLLMSASSRVSLRCKNLRNLSSSICTSPKSQQRSLWPLSRCTRKRISRR